MYDFIHKSTWTCITKGKDIVVNSLSTGNIKHFPTTRGKVLPPFFMNRAMTRWTISYIIYLKFQIFKDIFLWSNNSLQIFECQKNLTKKVSMIVSAKITEEAMLFY